MMKTICLFSDGSCLNNPGPGGWAYILEYKENIKKQSGGENNTTNNQMELRAVIEGIKALKEPCNIKLYTDSSYVANSINSWLEGWIKKDFKKVKNIELWKEYINVSQQHNINAIWVKAHNGHPQNEECDKMARDEAIKIKENGSFI
ncbi:ribonuclease HI [Campylobacter pinnipediorum subsp. pinnipediorum]|nr:ribonuclease HI [Campylobacter pinnipediorum subsp. pinnipediorum]